MPSTVIPLSQENRPQCSVPLSDADLSLGNANWSKGLQAMSDWIWSGNLNPAAFPNNLARYFLQIPAIFEQQLNYSATLIFDEPSFRNGRQVSGFVDRVARELVISFIGQRRRAWYTMTHHAVLGCLTAKKHGLTDAEIEAKWSRVTEHRSFPETFSLVEREVLKFADAFATNPKAYSDSDYQSLRMALASDNQARYAAENGWMDRMNSARTAHAMALLSGGSFPAEPATVASVKPSEPCGLTKEQNERKVDAQIVELAFICLQFVALTDVFSALNIPDEAFLSDVMQSLLPSEVIEKINELNRLGPSGMGSLVPPTLDIPTEDILSGRLEVSPCPLRGARLPLMPYETRTGDDPDKGLTVGGVQVGVYGWSFGLHFPGSLVYLLMHHPELARFEAPYSLPLLFNEDEWRNGTQTGGFVSRLKKELAIQKVYQTLRSRYGLEHHTMFLYNAYRDLFGVNRAPRPEMSDAQKQRAEMLAKQCADRAVIHMLNHESAPEGVFSDVEKVMLSWTHSVLTCPHRAHEYEARFRTELDKENRREVIAGLRCLDLTPGIGEEAAYKRLLDHQIAELAMMIGHMDGLGRLLTILRLESEDPVQAIKGKLDPITFGIAPELNANGHAIPTGYYNTRPGLLPILTSLASPSALTVNELLVNPSVNESAKLQLNAGARQVRIDAQTTLKTGEF